MLFYRTFDILRLDFNLTLIDLYGMGRSSWFEFTIEDVDECEDFFINSLESWRQKMNYD